MKPGPLWPTILIPLTELKTKKLFTCNDFNSCHFLAHFVYLHFFYVFFYPWNSKIWSKFDVHAVSNDVSGGWMSVLKGCTKHCLVQSGEEATLASVVLSTCPPNRIFSFFTSAECKTIDDHHFFAPFICSPDYCKLNKKYGTKHFWHTFLYAAVFHSHDSYM